jgi:hypothetical protein
MNPGVVLHSLKKADGGKFLNIGVAPYVKRFDDVERPSDLLTLPASHEIDEVYCEFTYLDVIQPGSAAFIHDGTIAFEPLPDRCK